MVVPRCYFGNSNNVSRCMFEKITSNHINNCLSTEPTIFSRNKLTEPCDKPMKIRTNQFRHYLNTIAHEEGLSEEIIAEWSGRNLITQNPAYRNVSPETILKKYKYANGTGGIFIPTSLVNQSEYDKIAPAVAQRTDYGFCVHDFSMLPCMKHQDHLTCGEHIYFKGDKKRNDNLHFRLAEEEALLARAEKQSSEGHAVAPLWINHSRFVVPILRKLVEVFEDPNIPDGTAIRLSNGMVRSEIDKTIEKRKKIGDSTAELLKRVIPINAQFEEQISSRLALSAPHQGDLIKDPYKYSRARKKRTRRRRS